MTKVQGLSIALGEDVLKARNVCWTARSANCYGIRLAASALKFVEGCIDKVGAGGGKTEAVMLIRYCLITDGEDRRDRVRTYRMRTIEEVTFHGNEDHRY